MSKRAKREAAGIEAEFDELAATLETVATSSLTVVVDFNDLYDRVGQVEAFEVVGKLKDLLG